MITSRPAHDPTLDREALSKNLIFELDSRFPPREDQRFRRDNFDNDSQGNAAVKIRTRQARRSVVVRRPRPLKQSAGDLFSRFEKERRYGEGRMCSLR
jgi:hypothetical protein